MAHATVRMQEILEGENRFDLKRQLADTLQGRIYSATDKNTGDYCVVKETWKQLVKLKRSRDGHRVPEDFENEKAIMSYLSHDSAPHPGFVRILDEWEDDHCYFYAMEGCRGGELFQYIKDQHTKGSLQSWVTSQSRMAQKPMKEDNEWTLMVKTMFRQLVDCVAWMHNRGVCHLDLSLENSMIHDRRKKHVKIIDFGLGKYFGNKDNLIEINRKYNTEKSVRQGGNPKTMNIKPQYSAIDTSEIDFTNDQRVGKTGYMAPEVYARQKYDARAADIWSLGVMLFMMCIGAPPYELPNDQNAAFRFIISGKLSEVLRHWRRLRLVTVEQLDLMVKIFRPEKGRITMEEILAHPFVDLKRRPLFNPKPPKRQPNANKNRQNNKVNNMAEVQEEKEPNDDNNNNNTDTNNTQNNKENNTGANGYRSPTAQKYESRIKNTDSSDVDGLRNILNDVEKQRNKLLAQKAKDKKGQVKIDINANNSNNNGNENGRMSPQTEEDRKNDDYIDPNTIDIVIDELEKIQNDVQQQIDVSRHKRNSSSFGDISGKLTALQKGVFGTFGIG